MSRKAQKRHLTIYLSNGQKHNHGHKAVSVVIKHVSKTSRLWN